ncbi:bifunctional 4-hydroxy-2-oxoglutarate aldolase/2-dehydro-3-deoxy-phosphogluconate aldolase [Ulvibacterium marinum]|uniref:Bifunctional 4-hydroxy-2-oxoglutarate aldolase/2-dehydro-3-deoxy-phosphogluconate aldolase n=1 Tax=Ulvibacterium marinum TaxID=2419782 RepID=A0A3B0C8J2_9FLAO|nr:bifunctional 4-hydroxy-2-oxoglutarate aldolase/2-dehydro-3-deoxy-phosphogluconate aldolase [Ulvibacterium marinum]RKN80911.1 bifunctional 4-hydroxy-2-oxoglutarate aldolase/2-dehydro-3-deoxy-phosphogluconate aldolase [Ulvibacterium marinum]
MQNNTPFSWEYFKEAPLVGIIRGLDMETILWIAQIYREAGLSTLEVTMNTPDAAMIISTLRKEFPELNIGAGTVCSPSDLQIALEAGSQFIVTPILDEEVIKNCVAQNIPIFPGAFTPTEIYKAWSLGASAVKVFPATQLGPQYIKDILGPLNNIKLMPTGGVSKDNIKSFFQAGAYGAGLGGSLFNKTLIGNGDYEGLKNHFKSFKKELEGLLPE